VVDYTKRTAMKDQLFTKIVKEVANSNGRLEWASSAVIPMSPPGDAGHESKALLPSSSTLGAGHAAGQSRWRNDLTLVVLKTC
jgi:hypothetical protein